MSGGWNPTVHLFSQSGGKLRWDEELAQFLPKTELKILFPLGVVMEHKVLTTASKQD